jgi:Polyketide cyclase / dehydrase and lipid transport
MHQSCGGFLMRHMQVSESAIITAPATAVYAIIADYQHGHPRILPKQYFRDLTVEAGGVGAGTVINFKAGMPGFMRAAHATITEPEPGRVLVETNAGSPPVFVTSFTVDPVQNGTAARVQIMTKWDTSPGIQGMIERLAFPPLLRRMYRAELRQLGEVMRQP